MQSEAGHEPDTAAETSTTDDARDDRDRAADKRDRAADEREQVADRRETVADAREQRLSAWEVRLDQRARLSGTAASTMRERSREATVRARALLAASAARLDRSEAAIRRADQSDTREQRAVDREIATATPPWLHAKGDASLMLTDRTVRLRTLLAAAARSLADAEDRIADHHRRLGRDHPDNSDQHLLAADNARTRAEVARETAQRFPK
jgi:hypothetical protein